MGANYNTFHNSVPYVIKPFSSYTYANIQMTEISHLAQKALERPYGIMERFQSLELNKPGFFSCTPTMWQALFACSSEVTKL